MLLDSTLSLVGQDPRGIHPHANWSFCFPFQFRRLEAGELLLNSYFRLAELLPLVLKHHDASQGLLASV